jgi:ribosomal protein L27
MQEAATSTNPTVLSNKADADTGVGWVSANIGSLVAGGVEAMRWTATGAAVAGDITANNFAGRNRIINGDFAIWQRGTSFSPGANAQVYTADRFFMNRNGVSEWTVSRQGYSEQYSCRVQRNVSTTSTQAMRVRQVLESANCGGIVGETVTFSCEIKVGANFSGASSNIFLTIAQGSGNDETGGKMATGFTGVVTTSSTIVGTTSFVKYSVTSGVIGATISQLGVLIEATPVGTAGANDWYEVRNVQLEVGATATEFEVRSVGNTLDLCQRYYNNASSITVNGNTAGMSANVTSGINYHAVVTFPVAMRVPPTLVWSEWSSSRFPTTAAVFQVAGNLGVNAYKGANSTGAGYFLGGYTATAEL